MKQPTTSNKQPSTLATSGGEIPPQHLHHLAAPAQPRQRRISLRHALEPHIHVEHVLPRTPRHRSRLDLRQIDPRRSQLRQRSHQRPRTMLHHERQAHLIRLPILRNQRRILPHNQVEPREVLGMVFNPTHQNLAPLPPPPPPRADPRHIPQPLCHQVLHTPGRVIKSHYLQPRMRSQILSALRQRHRMRDHLPNLLELPPRHSNQVMPYMPKALARNPHRQLQQQVIVLRYRPMQAVLDRQHSPIHLARNNPRQHLCRDRARNDLRIAQHRLRRHVAVRPQLALYRNLQALCLEPSYFLLTWQPRLTSGQLTTTKASSKNKAHGRKHCRSANRRKTYALDNNHHSIHPLGRRTRQQLHHGWLDSHSAGSRHHRPHLQPDVRPSSNIDLGQQSSQRNKEQYHEQGYRHRKSRAGRR